jgi:hypothetical protein
LSQTSAQAAASDAASGKGVPSEWLKRTQIDAGTLDTGSRISVGSCPSPIVTQTPLGAFTIDFSPYCPPLGWFGLIILAASMLVAARIVIGGL